MADWLPYLLPLLLLVPLAGAAACYAVREASAKWVALGTSLIELALTLGLVGTAFGEGREVVFAPDGAVIEALGSGLRLGCDAISWWLIFLTAGLMPISVAASFAGIRLRQRSYYFWLTALTMPMIGTFLARDGLLFYVFFELTLVPMFFLIGVWGGEDREFAARKFFLFTFVGGVFTFAGLLYLGIAAESFEFSAMVEAGQDISSPALKVALFLALLIGLAVKVPLFPLHTWLPLAHTVAPTAGSVILAGVLLKLGTYGLLRVGIPMGLLSDESIAGGDGLLPVMKEAVIPALAWLCIIGILYGALVSWVQTDVKKLVAYSSVSHLGFCVLGLFALTTIGVQGSVFYMISHGISTGALFLLIGMLYDRYHTRQFADYGGLGRAMPVFSFFLILFTMSSIGLPGTNGFVSEFLTILGAFTSPWLGPWYGSAAAVGVILGAVYMLYMAARLLFGPLRLPQVHAEDAHARPHAFTPGNAAAATVDYRSASTPLHGGGSIAFPESAEPPAVLPRDLNRREVGLLAPLAIAVIVLGVLPKQTILDSIRTGSERARVPAMLDYDPARTRIAGQRGGGQRGGQGRGAQQQQGSGGGGGQRTTGSPD